MPDKFAWCHITPVNGLRRMVESGKIAQHSSPMSIQKPCSFFTDGIRTREIKANSRAIPIAILMSPDLPKKSDYRLADTLIVQRQISLSRPLVLAIIAPHILLQSEWFTSYFLEEPRRGIDIQTFPSFENLLTEDYQRLLEAEYESLLKKYDLKRRSFVDLSEVTEIRRVFIEQLIDLIARDENFLNGIEWRELEHMLAKVFERLGFDVQLTPGSKDGGKDIVLKFRVSSSERIYYVEVKHWRSGKHVGSKEIREFLDIIVKENVSGGLYLSTYGYSPTAVESRTEIEREKLRLGTKSKLVSMCKTYLKAKAGLWIPEDPIQALWADTI